MRTIALTISWTAIAKVLLAIGLVFLTIELGRLMALIFLALLLSLALWKVVETAQRWGWPRWAGVALATIIVTGLVGGFAAFVLPALANQSSTLIAHLPEVQKKIVANLPDSGPLRDSANKVLESASFSDPKPWMEKLMAWGALVLTSLSEFLVILVIAIYFLIDGERIYRWLVAFLPLDQRSKVRIAVPQIVRIVSRYVGGQFITSALCSVYAFTVLAFLHVPNAALLAILAGILDILPVIGFFLFVIPAVGLALTVSPMAAALTAALYGVYHLLETYLIVPKVYGDQLKLSTLTVLISCMAGWILAGVLGAIAILPVIASYPVIEKLWLEPHLEPDTVPMHDAIEEQADTATAR